jgi:hypothetical protein
VSLLLWIPLIIAVVLLVLTLIAALLARVKGGKYLRPVVTVLSKIPFMRRFFTRMSLKAYEKSNPELASALTKLQAFGEPTTPEQAQRALKLLTPAERKAYLDAAGDQAAEAMAPTNRSQRRRAERGDTMKPEQKIVRGKRR